MVFTSELNLNNRQLNHLSQDDDIDLNLLIPNSKGAFDELIDTNKKASQSSVKKKGKLSIGLTT